MNDDKANGWVRSLVSALLAAAAAWGSVTVEINQVVDRKVEAMVYLLRKDLDSQVATQTDSIAAMLDHRFAAMLDTMASTAPAPAPIVRPVVVAPPALPDTITPQVLATIIALRAEVQRLAVTVRTQQLDQHRQLPRVRRKTDTP